MNTCNSKFRSNNSRILDIINEQNISEENRIKIMNKIDKFRHIILYIGNFTVLECSHKYSINIARGNYKGKLRDSWPLTLLCIQDYLSNYSLIEENPIKYSLETKEAQTFFRYYSELENGFEKFCDDHYLSQRYYNNSSDLAYVKEISNGKYEVNLDLFDDLSLTKPLPMNIVEIEQYIDRVTKKIIARGIIMLQKYLNNNI